MIDAVIFDMDGLLVDSEPLWQEARINAFGAERLRWTDADQHRVMGSSTRGWASFLAERLNFEYSIEEIIERVVQQMERRYREAVPLLPGAAEIIALLRGRYPLAIASGSSYRLLYAVLDSAGWNDAFADILSADDVARGKPAPDIYLESVRRLKVPVERVVIFEDSANGILAGAAAGAKVIAVPSAYLPPSRDVLDKAALVLPSLTDFRLEMLHNL